MNPIIKELESGISSFSSFEKTEKFKFIISSSNVIIHLKITDENLIKTLLAKIEGLRYEMSYDKGYESLLSFGLDYALVYESLKLARIIFNGKELMKFINDVIYYEINEGVKEVLLNELATL